MSIETMINPRISEHPQVLDWTSLLLVDGWMMCSCDVERAIQQAHAAVDQMRASGVWGAGIAIPQIPEFTHAIDPLGDGFAGEVYFGDLLIGSSPDAGRALGLVAAARRFAPWGWSVRLRLSGGVDLRDAAGMIYPGVLAVASLVEQIAFIDYERRFVTSPGDGNLVRVSVDGVPAGMW